MLITFLAPHENLREADLSLFFEVPLADGPDRTLHVRILVELIDLVLAVSVSPKRLIFGVSDGEYASFGSISFSCFDLYKRIVLCKRREGGHLKLGSCSWQYPRLLDYLAGAGSPAGRLALPPSPSGRRLGSPTRFSARAECTWAVAEAQGIWCPGSCPQLRGAFPRAQVVAHLSSLARSNR